jgi:serine/threonine-protein kinase
MGNPLDSERGPEPKPPALAAGQVIAGKFRVERVVGEGGMGLVVEAVNLQLDQRVALKFLRQDIERSPALVERFAREARAAVKLRSEHVARVSDVGSHPVYGPFMVMELLDGSTLGDVLVAGGPLPHHRAVEYVIHACEGLAEAHARGIVHQDVKPANLFLATGNDGRPRVKVLDFGISKATLSGPLSEKDATTGRGGAHIGTPHYLSPEQLRAVKDVDHRADVWALGCVLFELLTREKAFRAGRFTELVARILAAPRESVPAGVDVPAGLVEVIDRCLEKDRTKRFANTAELALALLPFARRRAARSVAERAVAHVRDGGLDPHLPMP